MIPNQLNSFSERDEQTVRANRPGETRLEPLPDALQAFRRVIREANKVILGKPKVIELAAICIAAKGHLLLEDMPGVGKTTLSHALARLLGLDFQRVQFTSDMLPADVIGVSIFDRGREQFRFQQGPVFTQVLLADEVNRATPKTQSALLEAMEERRVSVDGKTYDLSPAFTVIATQNPLHQIGTFALPESQLDRFLMRLEVGYPGRDAERALLRGEIRSQLIEQLEPVADEHVLGAVQQAVPKVHASDLLIDYVQAVIDYTRDSDQWLCGLSPRAGLALLRASQACALLNGDNYVQPEHVQSVLPAVVSHRLTSRGHEIGRVDNSSSASILNHVAVP